MSDTYDVKDKDVEVRDHEGQNPARVNIVDPLLRDGAVESNDYTHTSSALVDTMEQIEDEKAVETQSIMSNPTTQGLTGIDSTTSGVSLISDPKDMHEDVENANSTIKETDASNDALLSASSSPVLPDKNEEVSLSSPNLPLKSEGYDDKYPTEASTVPEPCNSLPAVDNVPGSCNSLPAADKDHCQPVVNVEENILLKTESNDDDTKNEPKQGDCSMDISENTDIGRRKLNVANVDATENFNKSLNLELCVADGYESGTEDEQVAFRKDVENYYRQNGLEFKAPKFYKEELNLLKLWRAVIKLGGYEQVTSRKLWRQVGESFRPPKTCTTVSWTFRIFYEKALFEYEKHKLRSGELPFSDNPFPEALRAESQLQTVGNQALAPGRARRDAAARAMQGWHSQRLLDNGEVCHPIIKNKTLSSFTDVDKQTKTNGSGLLKRKKPLGEDQTTTITPMKTAKSQSDTSIIDIGPPADWVKINVQKTSDCYEIYALVPGLLREEVHVQSDPAGRVIISGQPEQLDNPWGITPFKKVVGLPSRIDPHNTSAVVTLHGQLFVRVPFEPAR